ncbi:TrmH family RNA methyltransferase [Microbacterium sp. ASV49]|uniref:TrmH family RNA methyltransferase n=1 Tax=Microbacterium candidum TaxID=3041922 RepID=A0ABT7N119_9MICO|nr:TrmH family RNA methyltransferase [Microbacterium sp. ASV49]MDL9980405.1 TrmH family RNA methyltransferase [Microbacterium sp. ASV49]
MPATALLPGPGTAPGDAPFVDSARHPAIRRVSDVIRSRSATPRTLLLDDAHSIERAIHAGVGVEAIYATVKHADEAQRLHEGAPLADRVIVSKDVMRSLLPRDNAPRMLALARAPRAARWGDISAAAGDVLVLDGVRITGNIGAIVRSACALGAAGVVLLDSGLRSAYDRRLVRASRGLVFELPTVLAEPHDLVSFLHAEGMPLAGLSADADAPLEHIRRHAGRIAILIGSERFGASDALDAVTAARYAVPMATGVESLNVSVAAALALYERSGARRCAGSATARRRAAGA